MIDLTRLQAEIDELALITEDLPPVVTRVLFSKQDLAARAWLKGLCTEANLDLREDSVGNLFATWTGSDPSLSPVATGSHLDAIPNAGRFDGVVGVLGGLEAIRALQRSGYQPKRSIELILFTSEEPTRFGIGCLGSRLMSGSLTLEAAQALCDQTGRTFADWVSDTPYPADPQPQLDAGKYHAFVELHIEQGPILEREGFDVGAVTHIAAPAAYRVRLEGEGGHAGAVLMPERHDALCGAAEFALALEACAKTSGSPDTVATTGVMKVHPGAINSVPCLVEMEIDLRDIQLTTRTQTWAKTLAALDEITQRRGLTYSTSVINEDPPATCDSRLVEATEAAAAKLGFHCRRMISRAYHDSLFMARITPTSMIFIPCRHGYSHRPDEFSSPEQIEKGVATLAEVLKSMSKS